MAIIIAIANVNITIITLFVENVKSKTSFAP